MLLYVVCNLEAPGNRPLTETLSHWSILRKQHEQDGERRGVAVPALIKKQNVLTNSVRLRYRSTIYKARLILQWSFMIIWSSYNLYWSVMVLYRCLFMHYRCQVLWQWLQTHLWCRVLELDPGILWILVSVMLHVLPTVEVSQQWWYRGMVYWERVTWLHRPCCRVVGGWGLWLKGRSV